MQFSPATRRTLFRAVLGLLLVFLLAIFGFLWKRQQLLTYALGAVKSRVETKYPVRLTLGPARFSGFKTVEIDGMTLVPAADPADTLLTARRLVASLSVRSLFAGRPVFADLQIYHARLTARKTAAGSNYGFLVKKKAAPAPADTTQGRNYGALANQLLETAFDNIPEEADFRDFLVSYASPQHAITLRLPQFKIEDGDLSGRLSANIDGMVNELGLTGHIEPGDYAVDARVFGVGSSVQVPYIPARFGAIVSFDTVLVRLTGKDFDSDDTGGRLTLRGSLAARNFSLYHPKLASTEIEVRRGRLDFIATLGRAAASLDKGSVVTLNQLQLFPEISVRLKPSKAVSISVTSPETPANDFFASLPTGIFDALQGTQGTGTLQYAMHGSVDMAQVDSLRFDSRLKKSADFRLTQFGEEDLNKLNTDFLYTAYNDRGDTLRTFAVGPSNPDFTPYDQISPYLKGAITTAEDPRFFTHHGFMEKAFVKSAIQNIKEGRFARGGSTISMQLVKNVFLSRQKTIGRKAEEALMVWLIENTRLVSKERMFEVYLNVIEWGPSRYRWPSGKRGIYGVKDAALFYYAKRPDELTLPECLYLASIVPKPKYARGQFNQYGELRGSTRWFFRLIADLMVQRQLIRPDEHSGMPHLLPLNGPAGSFFSFAARPDTTRTTAAGDSTQFEPLNLIDLLNTGAAPDAGVNSGAPEVPGGE